MKSDHLAVRDNNNICPELFRNTFMVLKILKDTSDSPRWLENIGLEKQVDDRGNTPLTAKEINFIFSKNYNWAQLPIDTMEQVLEGAYLAGLLAKKEAGNEKSYWRPKSGSLL